MMEVSFLVISFLKVNFLGLLFVILYPIENNKSMNRLKVVLAEKNIKSKWVSEQLGVSRATVSKWVNNVSQPSLEMIDKLAKVLDVDYTELLRLDRKIENKEA